MIFGINVSLNFSGIMLIHSTATLTPPFGVRWKRLTSRRRSAGAAASWRCPWTRRGTTSQSGRSSSSVWPGKAYYDLDEVTIAIFSAIFISEPCWGRTRSCCWTRPQPRWTSRRTTWSSRRSRRPSGSAPSSPWPTDSTQSQTTTRFLSWKPERLLVVPPQLLLAAA